MILKNLCNRFVLGIIAVLFTSVVLEVAGGHYGPVVDDEIWHHVLGVLNKGYGSKIILDHPQPAYLVDHYTKVYKKPHYYPHHHHSHSHGHHHHHGHHDHHDYDDHYPIHNNHHHHEPLYHHRHAPVYKAPIDSYGAPPYFGHYKK